ncbi:Pimeloyl-ACP methyl ester carboxylesterase [Atopomonas hussainii]|uniref:Pimeloyl-ACP methyl ester carboxylesterase n=1 Tax=Atopomonas hussainii TaxID=1429083 RepID=A0A1H7LTK6_9GAMM|nr:alpha/beta hydrolase [Atopomonas hussainii]SEL01677.1 Pimeloyl-ACP methyl ester carboxylesterase [Atopomonas hussainii]
MQGFDHQLLEVNGITLSVYHCGPTSAKPLWLLHGFPECWYSWRHQVAPLLAAGYQLFMPEMRGYGQTSAPREPEAYDLFTIGDDIRAAWDALGQQQVAVIAHDWGAPVAWQLALREPTRVQAVVGMAVPYGGRPKQPATTIMRKLYAERFNYILYFQDVGAAEAEMDADIDRTLRVMLHSLSAAVPQDFFLQEKPASARLLDGLQAASELPVWCEPEAFARYRATFAERGFYGALNWYRNFERNWAQSEVLAEAKVEQPALFLLGDKDPVGTLEAYTLKQMPHWVPRLEQHVIADCGHWLQSEQADTVNSYLVDFLARHYPA